MLEQISNDHAILAVIKRLRRFAMMLTADEQAADHVVLGVVKVDLDPQGTAEDFGRVYHSLLRSVYRDIYAGSNRHRKLSLIDSDREQQPTAAVKFQSLEIDYRAIAALYLVEDMEREAIASVTGHEVADVDNIIAYCLEFLSLPFSTDHSDKTANKTASVVANIR